MASEKDSIDQHRKYHQQIQKRGKTADAVATGVRQAEFDPHGMTPDRIYTLYEELLEPLVQDKAMRDLVIDNIEKFKHGFSYKTTVRGIDKNGTPGVLGTIEDIGNRTIQRYVYDYTLDETHLVQRGQPFDSQQAKKIIDHLSVPGSGVNVIGNGKITEVRTIVTYTKGRNV